jgi:hypothetical protein
MDDSYKSGKGIYICSESFSLDENKFLIDILKSKFDLECSLHKVTNGYRIYIFTPVAPNLSSKKTGSIPSLKKDGN